MSVLSDLKDRIIAKIYQNTQQKVTGQAMQDSLLDMIDTMGVSVSQNTETGKTELKIGDTPALIVDNEPEVNSDNLVKSGGVANNIKDLKLNLFDFTQVLSSEKQTSKGLNLSGELVTIGWCFASPTYIKVTAGEKINYKLRTAAGNSIIAFYSSPDESSFISGVESNNEIQTGTVTVPSNAQYLRFCTYDWGDATYGYYIVLCIDERKLVFDSVPTKNSGNLVNSGDIYNYINKIYVNVSVQSQTGITIEDAPFCSITKSKGIKVKGQGTKQIILLYSTPISIGNVVTLAVKAPYYTQDKASIQFFGGWAIDMPSSTNKTRSGKSYKIQGETYQRVNYRTESVEYSNQITITTANETDEWEIWIGSKAVLNDVLPLSPILYIYDGGHWDGKVLYNGVSMSIWSLHRKLGIPYTIAMTEDEYLSEPCQQEVIDDINSGFADVITRIGSPYDYTGDDITVIDNIRESLNNCLNGDSGADSFCAVLAQHVFDKDALRCAKKSGIKMLRTYPTYDGIEKYGCKFNDYDIMMLSPHSVNYGSSMPTSFMGFPIILWAHGIGSPQSPHEQSLIGMYADSNGVDTIAAMQNILIAQNNGNAATMKASDWIAYCKKFSN